MPNGHEIADALALALGGSVRELPTEDRFERLVVLDDGRVPLLVRDFGHSLGVCLVGIRGWHERPAKFVDALVQEIVAVTQTWATTESRERATMFECAAVLVEFLAAHTGGPWTASVPGVVVPAELWLRPREGSASVGVFSDAVRVWQGERALERALVTRADLDVASSSMRAIAAAVDEQLAAHTNNPEPARRIEVVAERLSVLTIETLEVGREYEVRKNLQELRKGMIVRFDGFNDIDNHYGRYEFTSRDGRSIAVAGDFSSPRHSPLGAAHRYLAVLDSGAGNVAGREPREG